MRASCRSDGTSCIMASQRSSFDNRGGRDGLHSSLTLGVLLRPMVCDVSFGAEARLVGCNCWFESPLVGLIGALMCERPYKVNPSRRRT